MPVFDFVTAVDLGGVTSGWRTNSPNPDGLLGQVWIAVDPTVSGPTAGNVYILSSVDTPGDDPLDVTFVRSVDGAKSFSAPVRINDDPTDGNAWQWFGTMSVAPNGRIDVVWNDTRNGESFRFSELMYSYSIDGGNTWAPNETVTPVFDSHLGWPNQNKLGDYYHMISDDTGADLAYAATFNGEQDVYYVRLVPDCNGNGVLDWLDADDGESPDCNINHYPDECESDTDGDELIDACDPDIDGDGVANEEDVCAFTVVDGPVHANGRPRGDTNQDCAVALVDYGRFSYCLNRSGPGRSDNSVACRSAFDFDDDGDIDLDDARGMQRAFGAGE
jgi:hypothetical protein